MTFRSDYSADGNVSHRRYSALLGLAVSVLLSSCSTLPMESCHTISAAPFHFGESSPAKSARISIEQASVDFEAVINGKPPPFAKFDEEHPLPADGGTTFYRGSGYSLKIVKSLVRAGQVDGYIYGPVLTFDSTVSSGNSNEVTHLSFYSAKEMNTFLVTYSK